MAIAQSADIKGCRVAMLLTDGVEQVEYTSPRDFLEAHCARVTLIAPKKKGDKIQGFRHLIPADQFEVELGVDEAKPDDFDALVLPGGVANPDQIRSQPKAVDFVRGFARQEKPIAAICHGPWTLINAGIVAGKHMTSWPSLQADLRNAGADWSDEPVVIDGKLVTSRKPDDLDRFNDAILAQLARGTSSPKMGNLPG